jgi:hypothetical protein
MDAVNTPEPWDSDAGHDTMGHLDGDSGVAAVNLSEGIFGSGDDVGEEREETTLTLEVEGSIVDADSGSNTVGCEVAGDAPASDNYDDAYVDLVDQALVRKDDDYVESNDSKDPVTTLEPQQEETSGPKEEAVEDKEVTSAGTGGVVEAMNSYCAEASSNKVPLDENSTKVDSAVTQLVPSDASDSTKPNRPAKVKKIVPPVLTPAQVKVRSPDVF